jgi:hypothetical protein
MQTNFFFLEQLTLSPNARWTENAVTVAGQADGTYGPNSIMLHHNNGIFITDDDILYVTDTNNRRIVVIAPDSITPIEMIDITNSSTDQFVFPYDVLVTETYIFVLITSQTFVQKWFKNGTMSTTVSGTTTLGTSYYMFMDSFSNLYISDYYNTQVLCFAWNSVSNGTIVAGDGTAGSGNTQLNQPYGIFVDINSTVYVADGGNHRIQKWAFGASFGVTVAGTGVSGTSLTQLSSPSAVVVDANGYMYINEMQNSRITRWAPDSTIGECIAACTGTSGNDNNQLFWPQDLAFDSKNSLYVSDGSNNRVQKFEILPEESNLETSSAIMNILINSTTNVASHSTSAGKYFQNDLFNINSCSF